MLDQKKRTLKRLGIAGVATAMTTMGIPGIAGAATLHVAPNATTVTASAPGAPTGLTATPAGVGQVALKWTAPTGSTVDGYNVYFSTTSGGESGTTAANKDVLISGTSYTVAVPNSGTFYFEVAAVNSYGQGAFSNEASAAATAVTPGAPGSLTATAGDGAVALSWTGASGSPTGYTINYGTASNALTSQVKVSGSTTSDVVSGLTNGTAYYFDVVASNAAGAGTASSVVTATPSTSTAPLPPTGVTATGGNGQVTLKWNSSTNATGYNVYAGTKSGGESTTPVNGSVPIPATSASTVSTTVTVANGTTEYFTVKAINSVGMSAASQEVSATASAVAAVSTSAAPSAPQSLTATVVGPKAVKLTWAAPSNSGSSEVKKYFVEDKTGTAAYAAAKIVSPSTTGKNSTASTSAIVTSLTTSNTYSFEVYAENAQSLNGTAAKSPATTTPVTAEPLTSSKVVPEAPTLVSLSTVNTAAVSAKNTEGNTIKWTAPAYPTTGLKYQVVRNGVVIADVTGTSYRDSTSPSGTASAGALATDSAPVAGTTYSYKVTAVSSTSDTATSASSKIDTGSAAPGAPTKLSATETATAGTVSLSWTAPVDLGASGSTHKYVVLENNAAPTGTVTFGKTGTTATVTGVSSTASTSFTVEAEDTTGAGASLGHSGPSNAASVIAKAASGDAAAPTGLTAGGTSPSTIKLTWNASSTDGYTAPTNYLVYGSTSSKSLVSTGNELAKIDTSTSYTATGLSSGTKYYFEIVASPHATTPTGSNVASASTTSTAAVSNVPGAPTALKATDDGALVNLSWTAPTSAGAGITGYEIFSTTTDSPSGAVALGSTSGTGTTAYIDNLTAGTPIYLWAEALSSVGHSALSAPVEITPSSSSARPAAPSTPEVTAFAGGADVVWTPPSSVGTSPIIGYFVTAHLVNGKGKTIRVNSGSATSAKVTGLEAGTYYFTVVAINAVGGGAASAPSSFVNVSAIPTKVFVTAPKAIVGPGNVTIRVTVNQPSAKVQLFDEAYKGTSFFSKAIMMTTPAKYGNGVAEFTVHIAASNKFYAMVNGVKSNVVTAMVSN